VLLKLSNQLINNMFQKRAIVLGAGGFIGGHLVKKLKEEGYWVRGVDIKNNEYHNYADEFILGDLTDSNIVESVISENIDEVYQLAADMGGALYIFTGQNDANVMHNSALINLNVVHQCVKKKVKKVFYSSSACVYPEYNQMDPNNPKCAEKDAYPAEPDSEYGWEKLFSERLYLAYNRNYKLDVRIARFHNIFGPCGTYKGGKEKAPAAMCRKAIESENNSTFEVWGDGLQTRSFLYIDECIEGILRLMRQDSFLGPVNIGSEQMVSINDLAQMAIKLSGKNLKISNITGEEFYKKYGFKCPTGVRGRNSNNYLYKEKMNWSPTQPLDIGIKNTYEWIYNQIKNF
jgi:GDP-D-mannose 3',5'-epimerase